MQLIHRIMNCRYYIGCAKLFLGVKWPQFLLNFQFYAIIIATSPIVIIYDHALSPYEMDSAV